MIIKKMQCKICSVQCDLNIEIDSQKASITGNKCGRGIDYAKSQFSDDSVIVTARCILLNGSMGRLPVTSTAPIPIYMVDEVIEIIKNTQVIAPVSKDQIIIENVLNSGVDIVSQRRVK